MRRHNAHFTGLYVAQESRRAGQARAEDNAYASDGSSRFQSAATVDTSTPAARTSPATPLAAVQPGSLYALVHLCRAAGLPEPVPEYRFHPTRKWRADYAFLLTSPRVLVEVDGGAWTQGRHTRGYGFVEDQKKCNAAALLGFVVLRYTPDRLGECIDDLRVLFGGRSA